MHTHGHETTHNNNNNNIKDNNSLGKVRCVMRVREGERECYQKDKHYKKNKKNQQFST